MPETQAAAQIAKSAAKSPWAGVGAVLLTVVTGYMHNQQGQAKAMEAAKVLAENGEALANKSDDTNAAIMQMFQHEVEKRGKVEAEVALLKHQVERSNRSLIQVYRRLRKIREEQIGTHARLEHRISTTTPVSGPPPPKAHEDHDSDGIMDERDEAPPPPTPPPPPVPEKLDAETQASLKRISVPTILKKVEL
ncbi:MAG: hypothetical protein HN904_28940 [Victivallales bacterium]|jgi:hypothetical protein|nr:hypothetical protein [Victivallales bacterium]